MSAELFFQISVTIGAMQLVDGIMLLRDRGHASVPTMFASGVELAWCGVCCIALLRGWVEGAWQSIPIAFIGYHVACYFWARAIVENTTDAENALKNLRVPRTAVWAGLAFGITFGCASYAAFRSACD